MLNAGQINLLVHLKRFSVADQKTSLLALDTEKTQNKDNLLYSLRPLMKNGYISKRKDGLYGLLSPGKELTEHIHPILTIGGDAGGRHRAAEVSHMAALLNWHGIPTIPFIPPDGQNGFIPSAIWRTLRSGLISTTRFLGVLFYNELRLAVYHIENGDYEWQLRAECSLHFWNYNTSETRLTGILLVCDDGCAVETGKQIIRHTLWERKVLLEESRSQRTDPVRYSMKPIRLRADYKHSYLAEESEVIEVLRLAKSDKTAFERFKDMHSGSVAGKRECRFAFYPDSSNHHYLSISHDLLFLAYFYDGVKRKVQSDSRMTHKRSDECYTNHLYLPERLAEWGTFLKLPVTIHPLNEEEIRCLIS